MNILNDLYRLHSIKVRLRDTDANGIGYCFTCGKRIHYSEAHAGHFKSRRHLSTAWSDVNVNIQCQECNCGTKYMDDVYENKLRQKYSDEIIDELILTANTNYSKDFDFNELKTNLRFEIKRLLRNKNFNISY